MHTLEEHTRLARRVPEDIATNGDLQLVTDVFAEDAIEHSPAGDVHGREAILELLESFTDSFGDFSATVDDAVAEGDTVAMRLTWRGTHDGEFMGIEPTGASFEVENMVFTRIESGMIAERWVVPDMVGLYSQLGVLPSELTPPE